MKSKCKKGQYFRLLVSDETVGWLVYSYSAIGFFYGNETNVIMAILREVNSSQDEICEVKRDLLEKYTRLSKSEIKRNLNSLKNLGILSSITTKGCAVRYFNSRAIEVLKTVYRNGGKLSVWHLRNEMERLNIKSLLDVDDKLLRIVYALSGINPKEDGNDGPNMSHDTSENSFVQRAYEESAITADDLNAQYHIRKVQKTIENIIKQ